jgi:pantoate--beta-alanine ligase
MIIFKYEADVNNHLRKVKGSIGFVPTMGALHEGHISLLKRSKEICDNIVCSIFVNPTQFNNPDDFNKYPVTIEKDIFALEKNGCDILYLPGGEDIYPEGMAQKEHFNLGRLENILEGKFRPGHFQGVCQVVKRLLEIVKPTHLFLGQKDYQQCMVIKKLLKIMGTDIKVIICPTLREKNGLAMSSRNMRLSDDQKKNASMIYRSLTLIAEKLKPGNLQHLKEEAKEYLVKNNFKPDYIEIADAETLEIINEWDGNKNVVILAAVFMGEVRLIDNVVVTVSRQYS